MQFVSERWYRFYYSWMLLYSMGLAGACIAAIANPALQPYAERFELSRTTLALALVHIGYSLSVFFVVKKLGYPLATLSACMTFALILLHGLSQTNHGAGNLLYIIPWLLMVALNGMFSLAILVGSVFLTGVYVLLEYQFRLQDITPLSWFLLIGDIVLAAVCYQYWNRRFINTETRAVQQLSGQLRSRQAQSEILIQTISDGVIMFTTEGKVSLMNPAAAAMTGWAMDEANGIDIRLVTKLKAVDGKDLDEDLFSKVLEEKAHTSATLQIVSRDQQKQLIVSSVITPVILPKSQEMAGAVAVFRDISREHAEERQRADFISTASHEMRTPVAAIEGYLALALNDKVSKIDSKARDFLEKAHESTEHLGKLFQDLLTSAKAEDGRLSNHPSVVEMSDFLEKLADDLRFSAEKKGLTVEFLIGSHSSDTIDASGVSKIIKPLYYVHVDPDRIREVITNLFDNAVKYTEVGKISLGLTGDDSVVQVRVADTGHGIPADDIPHLFQKFYRVDNSATRTIGGTGLGLFICRKIVELYHGRIWVESQSEKGSVFYINLPRLTQDKAAQLQQTEAAKNQLPPVTSLVGS